MVMSSWTYYTALALLQNLDLKSLSEHAPVEGTPRHYERCTTVHCNLWLHVYLNKGPAVLNPLTTPGPRGAK